MNSNLQSRKPHLSANILLAILFVLSLSYPFIIYYFIDQWSPFYFVAGMASLLLLRAVLSYWAKTKSTQQRNPKILYFAFTIVAVLFITYLWNRQLAPLFYPVVMSLALAATMGLTLIYPPSLVERFARIKEPNLNDNGVRYTRKVTMLWTCFGIANAGIAYVTILLNNRALWTLYNGCISYIFIGLLMAGEYVVRRYCKQQHKDLKDLKDSKA